MPLTIPLCVAIFDHGPGFKHWSVFIDGREEADKILLQAMGSEGRYRFEEHVADARESGSLLELLELCTVDPTQVEEIKTIARGVPIRSDVPAWNCQDYVLDVLNTLEEANILSLGDSLYGAKKGKLLAKQEGFF